MANDWRYNTAFSDAPNTIGETVLVYLINQVLNESREFRYSRYAFETNTVFEARVQADIAAKLTLLNAQYDRRQDQGNRFRPSGTAAPPKNGGTT